ncbi:MAG: hypothetical protein IJY02_00180, partial [Oscillospiraceae bacterium]|nr:hypothetical protein [Oscillospiraceae bacterium]
ELDALLQKLCASSCDPLRCGERLQRRHPKDWNRIGSQNWPDLLPKADWNIDVTCTLTTFSGH